MIVITGASDGIGAAIARRLSKDHKVVLFGRDEDRLQKVAVDCGNADYYAFDINDSTERNKVVSSLKNVTVLINNAGVWHKTGDLDSISDDKINEVLQTNLVSQILLTKALLPNLRNKEGSAIINVISKSGVTAQQGQTVYTASKYGMRGFTDVLRIDTKDDPIRIGAVYQSGTNTDMFRKAGEDFPTDTFTEPEDLADVVTFMLSRPKNLWINEVRVEK